MREMRGHCEMLPSMVCERSVESDSGQEVLVRCESSEQKTRRVRRSNVSFRFHTHARARFYLTP